MNFTLPRNRDWFYITIGLVVTAIVFIGFARTYYLKAWFGTGPLTARLHLHGFALSAWLVLFLAARTYAQQCVALGALGRTRRAHRRGDGRGPRGRGYVWRVLLLPDERRAAATIRRRAGSAQRGGTAAWLGLPATSGASASPTR